jgi:putative ATPase
VISAFIKSMRGSDPDATVYWLARMVHGVRTPRYRPAHDDLASEDIGPAGPAVAPHGSRRIQGRRVGGWPEARIFLAHVASISPWLQCNAAYRAIDRALPMSVTVPHGVVPDHLRDRIARLGRLPPYRTA